MQVNSEPTTREARTNHTPSAPAAPPGAEVRAAVGHKLSAGDAEKAAALRKMKLVALALLVAMAVIFVFAFALQKEYPWLQYVRAAAEGGMVGALADWFAVTALFKYPMGIKIPHTAIIPRRKDQIGASLGEFVETNFLSEQVVQDKLASVNIARRAGEWHVPRRGRPGRLPRPLRRVSPDRRGRGRRLEAWDFVHCPPWTEHIFVGVGDEPCVVLGVGARRKGRGIVYPRNEVALAHGAGVTETTSDPREAYARFGEDTPVSSEEAFPL